VEKANLTNQEPVKAIDTGAYNVVVLQEDIPETTMAEFRVYAHKFVAKVRTSETRFELLPTESSQWGNA
jgi:hypothetical protein